jgi:Ca2+-binding EF-hand superfamily protein
MLRILLTGVALFSVVVCAAATAAPSEEECKAAFSRADKDQDGDLSGGELTWYLVAIQKDVRHSASAKDGKISFDEFMAACKEGVFDDMKEHQK